MTSTLFLFGCQKEKEPKPIYNDDLGGTEWKWVSEGMYCTLYFMSDTRVRATKNYFGIVGTFYYDYTYSDKEKKGVIKEWLEDPEACKFTISENCLTLGSNRKFYKQ